MTPRETKPEIFISYSHKDRKWLDKLQTHLAPLARRGSISVWADTMMLTGDRWKPEIEAALGKASVAVLLVTPNFLQSDFINNHELPSLLEGAAMRGVTIFWVAVSASLYKASPVSEYQAANDPERPLDTLTAAALNRALV